VRYFLDTDICIYALEDSDSPFYRRLSVMGPSRIAIPAIVEAELVLGALKSEQKEHNLATIESFLRPFDIIPFSHECTLAYARIRADLESTGTIIGANDLIIAATVVANDGVLVSHNVDEFRRVEGLAVQDWTR